MKKKNALFGNRIDPNCAYCIYGIEKEEEKPDCEKKRQPEEDGACKKFVYDPLKRKPKNLPDLPSFNPKDFEL